MIYILSFMVAVLVILWGISIYLIKADKLSAWDWQLNALGLPRGSVRAMLALAFISTLVVSTLQGIQIADLPDWAVGITGSIVGFYFGAASTRPEKGPTKPSSSEK